MTITTEEVRSAYIDLMWEYSNTTTEAEEAKFDKWLEAHDDEITAKAEARIIKLLLEHPICVDVDGSTYCDCSNETIEVSYKDHLLALIKRKAE